MCAAMCFELHHIIERSAGGSDAEDNLIVLCPNCHQHRIHRSKEVTPDQLRLYKRRLQDENEIQRRLQLHVAALKRELASQREQLDEANPSLLSAIIDDMLGSRDPLVVFELDVPGWTPSKSVGNLPITAEVYARVYELDGGGGFVVLILERLLEDVSRLDVATLRAVSSGRRDLFNDSEILDCLGPFRSGEEAEGHAERWALRACRRQAQQPHIDAPPPNER